MLVFLHIPKTAGMTFGQVMRHQYARGEVVNLNADGPAEAAQAWSTLPERRRARVKCVYGHLPLAPAMFGDQQANYITMLRDPIERSVSEYYYALRRPEHGLHPFLRRERMTLDRFVTTDLVTQICNEQVRRLSGADGPVQSGEFLDKALDNLRRHVVLAGLAERFDETLLLCRDLLGWNLLSYERLNVNRLRPTLERVSSATLAALNSLNRLDRELYRSVQKEFDRLVSEHGISARDVLALRRRSRLYGVVRRTMRFPLSIARDARTALRSWRAVHR